MRERQSVPLVIQNMSQRERMLLSSLSVRIGYIHCITSNIVRRHSFNPKPNTSLFFIKMQLSAKLSSLSYLHLSNFVLFRIINALKYILSVFAFNSLSVSLPTGNYFNFYFSPRFRAKEKFRRSRWERKQNGIIYTSCHIYILGRCVHGKV